MTLNVSWNTVYKTLLITFHSYFADKYDKIRCLKIASGKSYQSPHFQRWPLFHKYLCLDYFKIWSYFLYHSCRLWSVYANVKAFFMNKSSQKLDCFLMPKDIQHHLAHFIVLHHSSTTVALIYIIFLCGLSYASLHGCYHMPAKLGSTGWLVLMELNTFCHPVVHWLWEWEYGLLRKKLSDWLFLVYSSAALSEAACKKHDYCWARTMKKYYLCADFPTDSIFDASLKCSQSVMHGKCSGCSRQF